MPPYS